MHPHLNPNGMGLVSTLQALPDSVTCRVSGMLQKLIESGTNSGGQPPLFVSLDHGGGTTRRQLVRHWTHVNARPLLFLPTTLLSYQLTNQIGECGTLLLKVL